jgi:RecA/RadA recombinase
MAKSIDTSRVAKRFAAVDAASIVVAGIRKSFRNEESAFTMEEQQGRKEPIVPLWVPNPCWPIDWIFSNMRGFPTGRGAIVWGREASAKTALCHFTAGCFSRAGGIILWLDFDQVFDPNHFACYKIDPKRLVKVDVNTLEEGMDALKSGISALYGPVSKIKKGKRVDSDAPKGSNTPMLVAWDSLAAAAPEALFEKNAGESAGVGKSAAVITDQLKVLRVLTKGRPILPMLINEQRDIIGGMGGFSGPKTKMAGGHALKFYGRTILRTTMIHTDKDGKDRVRGAEYEMMANKAQYGVQSRKARFYVSFAKDGTGGVKVDKSNLMFLEDLGLLQPQGSKGVSIRGLKDSVGIFAKREFGEVLAKHEKKIREAVKETATTLKPPKGEDEEEE